MWVATEDLPRSAAHPFYRRLNQIFDQDDFDGYVEGLCQRFYADEVGRNGTRMAIFARSRGTRSHRRCGAQSCLWPGPQPTRSTTSISSIHYSAFASRRCHGSGWTVTLFVTSP